jgi:tetratricopeptide (TPR) repeat protein
VRAAADVVHRVAEARDAIDSGQLGLARRRLHGALTRARVAFGSRDPVVAVVLNQLGMLAKLTGDFAVARRHYLRALPIVRMHPRLEELELADLYHNLGGLEHARGRHAVGEPLARRAIALRSRRHGAAAIVTWLDRTAHAALLDGLGRHREAEAVYRMALHRFRRHFGSTHHEVAVTLNNLGCSLSAQGKRGAALRHLRRGLALKERLFGATHVEVAIALHNLGAVLRDADRAAEARPLLQRAHEIFRRCLGSAHPSTRACRRLLRPA